MNVKRVGWLIAAIGMGVGALAQPALADDTCSARAGQCDAICAARPAIPPYTSRYDRCAESCQPRWSQCLRTGLWVHLEDAKAGWREPVSRW